MNDEKSDAQMLAEIITNVNPGPLTFGDVVRAARIAAKLSQEECAKRAGLSQVYWCKVECDRSDPSKCYLKYRKKLLEYARGGGSPTKYIRRLFQESNERMKRFADALGVSVEQLVAPLVDREEN